jgi:hypothetical protein
MKHVRRDWPSHLTPGESESTASLLWYPMCGRDFHDQSELVSESTFIKSDDRCWECAAILGVEEEA